VKTRLAKYWTENKPDIVMSVVPNLNRAIASSVAEAIPHTPFVTLLTDFADTPPHFWMEAQSQYLLCGTRRAAEQALAMGHASARVIQTSGMILHPRFYHDATEDRAALRAKLGLAPDRATVLVMFGGQGSYEMLQISEALSNCCSPIQVVYICGRNEALRQKLERLPSRSPGIVLGFTTEVPAYMEASDLMIGKPGPGSVSEALHFGLPVIVCRNGSTMPQEIYNTYWIEENGVGLVLRDFRCIDQQIDSLLNDGRLEKMKASAKAVKNEAIFEVPKILKEILASHQIAS
jgi:UDP-N-acetylglucosamine:LPS N-acetylglucosamine transferase